MRSEGSDLEVDTALRSSPTPFTDACKRILNQRVPHDPRHRTVLDLVVETIFLKALKGDLQAIKEITDRVEGRVPQSRPREQDERPTAINIISHIPRPKRKTSGVVNIAS
jgi:hypothetical protein